MWMKAHARYSIVQHQQSEIRTLPQPVSPVTSTTRPVFSAFFIMDKNSSLALAAGRPFLALFIDTLSLGKAIAGGVCFGVLLQKKLFSRGRRCAGGRLPLLSAFFFLDLSPAAAELPPV